MNQIRRLSGDCYLIPIRKRIERLDSLSSLAEQLRFYVVPSMKDFLWGST